MDIDDGELAKALKVRENRLRRTAVRQGLFLSRRRRTDPHARDFGKYALLKGGPHGKAVHGIARNGDYLLTLDQVEQTLTGEPVDPGGVAPVKPPPPPPPEGTIRTPGALIRGSTPPPKSRRARMRAQREMERRGFTS